MINEEELVKQLKDPVSREGAFHLLVKEYQKPLYWLIRHVVLSHEDANDVLQNTFFKAWRSIGAFEGRSQLRTWLYRIALNETMSFMENRGNTIPLEQIDNPDYDALQSDSNLDGDRTQKLLFEALESLPKKQREVFEMRYFRNMKYEEISELLGTSVGALKASYHHAVKKVNAFFQSLD